MEMQDVRQQADGDNLLPSHVPRSDEESGRKRRLPLCWCYVIIAAFVLVVAGAVTPTISQSIIDGTVLEIGAIRLTDPAGMAVTMACEASMALPRLPLPASTGPLLLSAALADEPDAPVGVFDVPQGLEMGMGGTVTLAFAGSLTVNDAAAFQRLATRIIHSDSLELQLVTARPFELRVGVLTIPGMTLNKTVALQGAAGLDLKVSRFLASEATHDYPGYGQPLLLDLLVDVSNPSSFGFGPMGAMSLQVRSSDGTAIATVRTPMLELPHGPSTLSLSGVATVDPRDAAALSSFERLLGDYASGMDTTLQGVVRNVSSPVYDAALRQLALDVLLPGLEAPLIEVVAMVVDYGAALNSLLWTHQIEVGAHVLLANPFNASLDVKSMDVEVTKGAPPVHLGTMDLTLDPQDLDYDLNRNLQPLLLPPLGEVLSADLLPAKIDGPITDVQAMLSQMQAGETVLCDVEGTLAIAAGNLLLRNVHYRQLNVSVIEYHSPPSPPGPPREPESPATGFFG